MFRAPNKALIPCLDTFNEVAKKRRKKVPLPKIKKNQKKKNLLQPTKGTKGDFIERKKQLKSPTCSLEEVFAKFPVKRYIKPEKTTNFSIKTEDLNAVSKKIENSVSKKISHLGRIHQIMNTKKNSTDYEFEKNPDGKTEKSMRSLSIMNDRRLGSSKRENTSLKQKSSLNKINISKKNTSSLEKIIDEWENKPKKKAIKLLSNVSFSSTIEKTICVEEIYKSLKPAADKILNKIENEKIIKRNEGFEKTNKISEINKSKIPDEKVTNDNVEKISSPTESKCQKCLYEIENSEKTKKENADQFFHETSLIPKKTNKKCGNFEKTEKKTQKKMSNVKNKIPGKNKDKIRNIKTINKKIRKKNSDETSKMFKKNSNKNAHKSHNMPQSSDPDTSMGKNMERKKAESFENHKQNSKKAKHKSLDHISSSRKTQKIEANLAKKSKDYLSTESLDRLFTRKIIESLENNSHQKHKKKKKVTKSPEKKKSKLEVKENETQISIKVKSRKNRKQNETLLRGLFAALTQEKMRPKIAKSKAESCTEFLGSRDKEMFCPFKKKDFNDDSLHDSFHSASFASRQQLSAVNLYEKKLKLRNEIFKVDSLIHRLCRNKS